MRPLSRMIVGATAATLATAVCLTAAPSVRAADGDIPILGQALTMGGSEDGDPAVVSVHGVRRMPTTTIVYWSITLPKNAPTDRDFSGYYMSGMTDNMFSKGTDKVGDVALIDPTAGLLYQPAKAAVTGYQCVCPRWSTPQFFERGQAGVFFSGIGPLPASVKSVDVAVADQIIPNVPVEDGLMEPASTKEKGPWILGMGWPPIDPQLLATATAPKPLPVTARVSDITNTVTTSKGSVSLNTNVLFATDSATLTPKAGAALAQAVARIKASGSRKLDVTGHTDSDGSDSYNLTLSKKRADAVAARLKTLLGGGYAFTTAGKGETQPIADNTTDSGKATNRRVTITFTGGN